MTAVNGGSGEKAFALGKKRKGGIGGQKPGLENLCKEKAKSGHKQGRRRARAKRQKKPLQGGRERKQCSILWAEQEKGPVSEPSRKKRDKFASGVND